MEQSLKQHTDKIKDAFYKKECEETLATLAESDMLNNDSDVELLVYHFRQLDLIKQTADSVSECLVRKLLRVEKKRECSDLNTVPQSKRSRGVSIEATTVLKAWLFEHIVRLVSIIG